MHVGRDEVLPRLYLGDIISGSLPLKKYLGGLGASPHLDIFEKMRQVG